MKKTMSTVKMKRVLSMLLILCLVLFSMVSCTSGQNPKGISNVVDDIDSGTPDNAGDIVINGNDTTDYNLLDSMQSDTLLYPSQNDEWSYNVYNTYIEITGYLGNSDTEIIVPEEIDNLPVRAYSIKTWFLEDIPETVTSVKLPSTLVLIGERAFENHQALKSIHLPEGLMEIDESAFKSCSQLSDIEFPSTLVRIGSSAFQYCGSIKSLTLPASLEKIEAGAFWGCRLEEVTILNPHISLDDSNLSSDMIYGYIGSTAAAYAAKYKHSFKVIEE